LVREKNPTICTETGEIVAEFRRHYVDGDTMIFDPLPAAKFSTYFFRAHDERERKATVSADGAHQLIEEATLFVDAAHQCYLRLASALKEAGPVAVRDGGRSETNGRTA